MARKADGLPFEFGLGFSKKKWRGQDSIVFPLNAKAHGTEERQDVVVKLDHLVHGEGEDPAKRKAEIASHELGIRYKKQKYELLKFFLGDFVPNAIFALGEKHDADKKRIKEITVQERLPDVQLNQLTAEQRHDPRLLGNLHELLSRLIYMHQVVRRVNDAVPEAARIDVQLDLGAISRKLRESDTLMDIEFDWNNPDLFKTKNILVDPKTMRVFCVDFGRGKWSDAKEATLRLILASATADRQAAE